MLELNNNEDFIVYKYEIDDYFCNEVKRKIIDLD